MSRKFVFFYQYHSLYPTVVEWDTLYCAVLEKPNFLQLTNAYGRYVFDIPVPCFKIYDFRKDEISWVSAGWVPPNHGIQILDIETPTEDTYEKFSHSKTYKGSAG